MEIGKVYRYSGETEKMKPEMLEVDNLPNYFHHTYDPVSKIRVMLNHGIQHLKSVTGPDGISRCPALIISSSPHRYGTDQTPWEDSYDPDFGYVCYYGDNKTSAVRPGNAPGNKMMLDAFRYHSAPSQEDRAKYGIPILFFKRVIYDGRIKGNLMFQGFGVIEKVEMVTQYDSKGNYFANYMFDLCVFTMKSEKEHFDWSWINARRNPELSVKDTLKFAPKAWKTWVEKGSTNLSEVRRKISSLSVVKTFDQQPAVGSKEERVLSQIYDYYKTNRHSFEMLAMRVAEHIFSESGIKIIPGWITSKSSDGGIDFVMRMDIDQGLSGTKIVILGQAKCEKPDMPTNGQHIARTVARLKRGWIGAYVTTSYFSSSVQQEVIDDQYPIMLINGKKIAETVSDILVKNGLSLSEYLDDLDNQYEFNTKNRRADEILRY
jgi:hypothetical protein